MNLFSPAEVVANYAAAGAAKTRLPVWKILLLGMLAGFCIATAAAATNVISHNAGAAASVRLLSGLVFPLGLIMVILLGAELFTGNCLISIAVLDGTATVGGMLRNWSCAYVGNFVGAALTAAACVYAGQLHYSDGGLALFTMKLAAAKCALAFVPAVLLGVLCNVLVCAAVLLALSGKDLCGRAAGAYFPVAFFVMCGFEHSVANMFYVPAALFAKSVPLYAQKAADAGLDLSGLTWKNFLAGNLLPVTLGNVGGGVLFGALMWGCFAKKKT